MLVVFHIFVGFLIFLMVLISSFKQWRSENILEIISAFNFAKPCFLILWCVLENDMCTLENNMHSAAAAWLDGMFLKCLLGSFDLAHGSSHFLVDCQSA